MHAMSGQQILSYQLRPRNWIQAIRLVASSPPASAISLTPQSHTLLQSFSFYTSRVSSLSRVEFPCLHPNVMFTFLACPLCFIMKCITFCIFSDVNINIFREKTGNWPWWHIPGSLALGRLRQEECFAFEPTWATWYTLGHTGVHWKTCRFGRRAACLLCKQ